MDKINPIFSLLGVFGGVSIAKLLLILYPQLSSDSPWLFKSYFVVIQLYVFFAALVAGIIGSLATDTQSARKTGDFAGVTTGMILVWNPFWNQEGVMAYIGGGLLISIVYGFAGYLGGSIIRDIKSPSKKEG